jgi:hypothetical protein
MWGKEKEERLKEGVGWEEGYGGKNCRVLYCGM